MADTEETTEEQVAPEAPAVEPVAEKPVETQVAPAARTDTEITKGFQRTLTKLHQGHEMPKFLKDMGIDSVEDLKTKMQPPAPAPEPVVVEPAPDFDIQDGDTSEDIVAKVRQAVKAELVARDDETRAEAFTDEEARLEVALKETFDWAVDDPKWAAARGALRSVVDSMADPNKPATERQIADSIGLVKQVLGGSANKTTTAEPEPPEVHSGGPGGAAPPEPLTPQQRVEQGKTRAFEIVDRKMREAGLR